MNFAQLNFFDKVSLARVTDVIRDGEFSDADIHFDRSQHTVRLPIWKVDEDLSRCERATLLGWWRISPKRKLELQFKSIQDIEIVKDTNFLGKHGIGSVEWEMPRTIRLYTYDGMLITMAAQELHGMLTITDNVDWNRTQRIRSWIFCPKLACCENLMEKPPNSGIH